MKSELVVEYKVSCRKWRDPNMVYESSPKRESLHTTMVRDRRLDGMPDSAYGCDNGLRIREGGVNRRWMLYAETDRDE